LSANIFLLIVSCLLSNFIIKIKIKLKGQSKTKDRKETKQMRFLKSNPIFSLVNSYLIDSPQPANISYMWNFGSLLGICLVIQILTGVFLAMHYTPNVELAFISVEHI